MLSWWLPSTFLVHWNFAIISAGPSFLCQLLFTLRNKIIIIIYIIAIINIFLFLFPLIFIFIFITLLIIFIRHLILFYHYHIITAIFIIIITVVFVIIIHNLWISFFERVSHFFIMACIIPIFVRFFAFSTRVDINFRLVKRNHCNLFASIICDEGQWCTLYIGWIHWTCQR